MIAPNKMRQKVEGFLLAYYAARIELVYVEPSLSVIYQQNARRPQPVPKQVIQRLVEKLEPPTWTEAHALRLTP